MKLGTWQLVADFTFYEDVKTAIDLLDDGGALIYEVRLDGIKVNPNHPRAHDLIGRCVNPVAFGCPEERH